jgi:hypothetical protein
VILFGSCFPQDDEIYTVKSTDEVEAGKIDVFYEGKNIYETEEEYLNAYYDLNYFRYRDIMLYRCLRKNDFTYFETEILDNDRLVGNQIYSGYMETIKEVIHIKNNLSFDNKEIDDYFVSIYEYYDPKNPKNLSFNEERILLQINSLLNPKEEMVEIEELKDIISGIWQKGSYEINSGYLDTLRFSDEIMAISINEMDHSKRFSGLEGKYRIIDNTIIIEPEYYNYITGGIYIDEDRDGLIQDYIGKKTERIGLPSNVMISYPIVSLSRIYNGFENRFYYKLILFIDRPVVYYKIMEEWKKMPWE